MARSATLPIRRRSFERRTHVHALGERLLPAATLSDSVGILTRILVPTLAKGVIIRRAAAVELVERFDLDSRAIRYMQRLRHGYGPGPLRFGPRWRRYALVLSPDHVRPILEGTPDPFAADSREKRAALSHFQPQGVLISHGPERADRRRFNEAVLDTDRTVHHLGDRFVSVVHQEAAHLLTAVEGAGALTWDSFATAWFRIVRRVVFGDAARDDLALMDLLGRLRADANWAFLRPKRTAVRNRFFDQLHRYLGRAEPGSLAAVMAETPKTAETAPAHQIPQWLFASDPAGMSTFRALALLSAHADQAERARNEIHGATAPHHELPFLRACVLEAVRLWPTAPLVLRETTSDTMWEDGMMPAATGIILFAPFFHRDDERLPFAHRFAPDIWLEERPDEAWSLIPFSLGPARCPGRNLVLLLTSTMLAALIDGRTFRLMPPTRIDARQPLPGTLNHFSLRFEIGSPRPA